MDGKMNNVGMQEPPKEFHNKESGNIYRPEFVPCAGLFNLPVFDAKNRLLGRAVLTQHLNPGEKEGEVQELVILLDIIIYDPEDRGKGIGDELMGFTTAWFPRIITGLSTKAGRALCLKHGFRWKKSMFKNQPDFLIYEKEEKDGNEASGIQSSSEQDSPAAGSKHGQGGRYLGEVEPGSIGEGEEGESATEASEGVGDISKEGGRDAEK